MELPFDVPPGVPEGLVWTVVAAAVLVVRAYGGLPLLIKVGTMP